MYLHAFSKTASINFEKNGHFKEGLYENLYKISNSYFVFIDLVNYLA